MANPQNPAPSNPPPPHPPKGSSGKGGRSERNAPTNIILFLVIGGLLLTVVFLFYSESNKEEEIPTSRFFAGVQDDTYNSQNVHELKITRGYLRFQAQPKDTGKGENGALRSGT